MENKNQEPTRKREFSYWYIIWIVAVIVLVYLIVRPYIPALMPNSGYDISGVHIGGKVFYITEVSIDGAEDYLANELLSVHYDGDDPALGSLYGFNIEDEIAESYPMQAWATSYEQIAESAGVIAFSLNRVERILTHRPNDSILIDVRNNDEYALGRIVESTNIPLGSLAEQIENFVTEDSIIIIYGQNNSQSLQAARILVDAGYKLVFDAGSLDSYDGVLE